MQLAVWLRVCAQSAAALQHWEREREEEGDGSRMGTIRIPCSDWDSSSSSSPALHPSLPTTRADTVVWVVTWVRCPVLYCRYELRQSWLFRTGSSLACSNLLSRSMTRWTTCPFFISQIYIRIQAIESHHLLAVATRPSLWS